MNKIAFRMYGDISRIYREIQSEGYRVKRIEDFLNQCDKELQYPNEENVFFCDEDDVGNPFWWAWNTAVYMKCIIWFAKQYEDYEDRNVVPIGAEFYVDEHPNIWRESDPKSFDEEEDSETELDAKLRYIYKCRSWHNTRPKQFELLENAITYFAREKYIVEAALEYKEIQLQAMKDDKYPDSFITNKKNEIDYLKQSKERYHKIETYAVELYLDSYELLYEDYAFQQLVNRYKYVEKNKSLQNALIRKYGIKEVKIRDNLKTVAYQMGGWQSGNEMIKFYIDDWKRYVDDKQRFSKTAIYLATDKNTEFIRDVLLTDAILRDVVTLENRLFWETVDIAKKNLESERKDVNNCDDFKQSTERPQPGKSFLKKVKTRYLDEIKDHTRVNALIVEQNKNITLVIDLEKHPAQQKFIGKKVNDTIKLEGVSVTYKILEITEWYV